MTSEQIWEPVPIEDYKNFYQISSNGRVKNRNGRVLKISKQNGYICVTLSYDYKIKRFLVHRLVALAFIPNSDSKPFINHKNRNKTDNRVENLEWVTSKENAQHAIETGMKNGRIKAVEQVDKCGNVIQEFESASEASRKTGIYRKSICDACIGRTRSRKAGGYFWRFSEKDNKITIDLTGYETISGFEGLYKINQKGDVYSIMKKQLLIPWFINKKATIRLSRDKKGFNKIVGILVAQTFIPNPENKACVCHINGDLKDNGVENLKWASRSEITKNTYNLGKNSNRKRVGQYDLDGNLIREFENIRQASKEVFGISYSIGSISQCCKGRYGQYKGFIWKYL